MCDKRSVPVPGERVPYILVENDSDSRVIACVREPGELLANPALRLNYAYYVNRHVLPALHRVLDLDDLQVSVLALPFVVAPASQGTLF